MSIVFDKMKTRMNLIKEYQKNNNLSYYTIHLFLYYSSILSYSSYYPSLYIINKN